MKIVEENVGGTFLEIFFFWYVSSGKEQKQK